MNLWDIILWAVIGGIAGFLADLVIKGINLKTYQRVIVGMVGAFVGGWGFDLLGINIGSDLFATGIAAFVGAVLLLLILSLVLKKK